MFMYIEGFFVSKHMLHEQKKKKKLKKIADIFFIRINRKSNDLFDNRLSFSSSFSNDLFS